MPDTHQSEPSAPHATGPRHAGLVFGVAPLAVFVLAQLVFDLAGWNAADLVRLQSAAASPDATGEVAARVLWAASVLVFHVAAIAALIGAGALLVVHVGARQRRRYAAGFVLLSGAALAHLAFSSETRNAFSGIYFFTYEQLAACECLEPEQLARYAWMETAVNVVAAVAPMVLLLATCAVLEPSDLDGAPALREVQGRMRRLNRLLNLASALLVAGMLNMALWLRWPGALLDGAPSTGAVTEAVTFFWGTVFTLVVASLYIPASIELNRRAEALLARYPDTKGSARDTSEWLQRHGLSLTPTQQLPQVIAMLAPMLAGSMGSGLAEVPGALLGR